MQGLDTRAIGADTPPTEQAGCSVVTGFVAIRDAPGRGDRP
jgi:hypothetical protein